MCTYQLLYRCYYPIIPASTYIICRLLSKLPYYCAWVYKRIQRRTLYIYALFLLLLKRPFEKSVFSWMQFSIYKQYIYYMYRQLYFYTSCRPLRQVSRVVFYSFSSRHCPRSTTTTFIYSRLRFDKCNIYLPKHNYMYLYHEFKQRCV